MLNKKEMKEMVNGPKEAFFFGKVMSFSYVVTVVRFYILSCRPLLNRFMLGCHVIFTCIVCF